MTINNNFLKPNESGSFDAEISLRDAIRAAIRGLVLASSISALSLAFAMGPVHTNGDGISLGTSRAMADDNGGSEDSSDESSEDSSDDSGDDSGDDS
ncbi:MAG: hypothetical protein OEL50_02355, partial [Rhodospirillaceae bacterium]|nr:hypothetical protein [Rhodospirillaceae bacterium]